MSPRCRKKARTAKRGPQASGLAVPYSPEYAALKPNTPLLLRVAELTGGKALTNGETVFQDRRIRRLPVPLAFPLLLTALLLFPLDVAVRRLFVGTRQAEQAAQFVRTKVGESVAGRAAKQAERAAVLASASSVGKLNQNKRARGEQAAEAGEETAAPAPQTPLMGRTPPPPPRSSSEGGVVWGSGGNAPNHTPQNPPAPPKPAAPPPPTGGNSEGDYLARLRGSQTAG